MTDDRQEVSPEDVAEGFRAWAEFPREDVLALLQSLEAAVQGIAFNCPKSQDLENLTTAVDAVAKQHEASAETLGDMAETLGNADARMSAAKSLGKPGAHISVAETLGDVAKTLGKPRLRASTAETPDNTNESTSITSVSISETLGSMDDRISRLNDNTKAIRSSIRYLAVVMSLILLVMVADAIPRLIPLLS